jgi:hypothetical protein
MGTKTVLTFDQAGNMKVDATGFVGKACAETTEKLLKGLGAKTVEETKKPEFNQLARGGKVEAPTRW